MGDKAVVQAVVFVDGGGVEIEWGRRPNWGEVARGSGSK